MLLRTSLEPLWISINNPLRRLKGLSDGFVQAAPDVPLRFHRLLYGSGDGPGSRLD